MPHQLWVSNDAYGTKKGVTLLKQLFILGTEVGQPALCSFNNGNITPCNSLLRFLFRCASFTLCFKFS